MQNIEMEDVEYRNARCNLEELPMQNKPFLVFTQIHIWRLQTSYIIYLPGESCQISLYFFSNFLAIFIVCQRTYIITSKNWWKVLTNKHSTLSQLRINLPCITVVGTEARNENIFFSVGIECRLSFYRVPILWKLI